jgi:hypothetical protein
MQHLTSKHSFNEATVLDPLSESDAPPTKKLNKGKERSQQPASVPESRRTSRTLPSRGVATDATKSAGTSSRPVAPILMAVDDGVILGMDQGLKLMLEMMERQEVSTLLSPTVSDRNRVEPSGSDRNLLGNLGIC